MDLLRLIGPGIRVLTIQAALPAFGRPYLLSADDCCDAILEACPHLESLELSNLRMDSLTFLLKAYESGNCKLVVFKVVQRNALDIGESILRVFAAMGDKHHPAFRYLREFVVYPIQIPDDLVSEMQSALVKVLDENKRLAVFDVRFRTIGSTVVNQLSAWAQQFAAYHGEMISRSRSPLSIRQRLACLSVVHHHDGSQRALEQLDTHVLSLIFKMAAQCMRRHVYVGREFHAWEE